MGRLTVMERHATDGDWTNHALADVRFTAQQITLNMRRLNMLEYAISVSRCNELHAAVLGVDIMQW